jgi:GNAT superfamily N-acetyltransferase
MTTTHAQAAQAVIRPLGRAGDLGWIVMAHGETYATEFGWDTTFEALVAQIVADYAARHDPEREAAWIAEIDGRRVGCILCVAADPSPETAGGNPGDSEPTAQLRILLVHPDARGRHLGRRLLDTALEFARASGYPKARLWTNDPLVSARRIYLERGFKLTHEQAHHSFGVDLVGQNYELTL